MTRKKLTFWGPSQYKDVATPRFRLLCAPWHPSQCAAGDWSVMHLKTSSFSPDIWNTNILPTSNDEILPNTCLIVITCISVPFEKLILFPRVMQGGHQTCLHLWTLTFDILWSFVWFKVSLQHMEPYNKMADILLTFSNASSWSKSFKFQIKFNEMCYKRQWTRLNHSRLFT